MRAMKSHGTIPNRVIVSTLPVTGVEILSIVEYLVLFVIVVSLTRLCHPNDCPINQIVVTQCHALLHRHSESLMMSFSQFVASMSS